MKRLLWFFIAGLTAFSIGACGTKGNSQQTGKPTAVSVRSTEVITEKVTGMDSYPATVIPLNEVEIRPQVSGYVSQIFIKDGQKVSKGQKLYEIDRSKYEAAFLQAKANAESARANLERVEKDVMRYKVLDEKQAIAKQQLDNANAELLTARAQLASAEAQVKSAATDYGYSLIKAPFSGTVGISQVRLGTQVSPGQSLLNVLSSDDPVLVDFVISEREIRRFKNLLHKDNLPDSTFSIQYGDGSIYDKYGKLVTIDRAVGRRSGTISLRVEFPNPNRDLIPGMTVNLKVLNQDIGEQLVIPYKSVTEQMGEYFVYVIDEENLVHQQNVVLGTKVGSDIVVREGLSPGEKIVVEGIQKLREGAKVETES